MERVASTVMSVWDLASPTSLALAGICVVLAAFYHYNTCYRGRWEKYGIPVPPAWPVINHYPKFKSGEEAPLAGWFQEFGDTYGTYGMFPRVPVLVTRDIHLIKNILVKDYWNFMDRFQERLTWGCISRSLFNAKGNTWRRFRLVMDPMFTARKLRIMVTHVRNSSNNLRDLVELYYKEGELIPVKHICGKFAAETIARVGFGIDTHDVMKGETEFHTKSSKYFRFSTPAQLWVQYLSHFFPPLFNIVRRLGLKVDIFNEDTEAYYDRLLREEIARRITQHKQRCNLETRDMLDIFLEALVPDGDAKLNDPELRAVTQDEIVMNVINLVAAAFETISSVLQSTIYYLALYPEIQQRILDAVDQEVGDSEEISYDHLQNLNYIEQVFNESMRLQPPVSTLFRQSIEERTYEGITIPARSKIVISVISIMNNPKLWGEHPEKFDPDRFSPENSKTRDPIAFMPFGFGPKMCIGKRFAVLKLKMVIATLLRKFRFEMSERSEPPIGRQVEIVREEVAFNRPSKPVMVEAVLRQK